MKKTILTAALVCTYLSAAPVALADIIFDNGETASMGGFPSDGIFNLAADNFVLAQGENTITDIHWWGFFSGVDKIVPTDNFTVFIYADNSGEPGAAPLYTYTNSVQTTDNGTSAFGTLPEYEYVMNIDPLELTAGTTYWLAIANDIGISVKGAIFLEQWNWAYSNVQAGDAHAKSPTAWVDLNTEFAFQLTNDGVVPEPASILLMGLGLGGMALRARKKRS